MINLETIKQRSKEWKKLNEENEKQMKFEEEKRIEEKVKKSSHKNKANSDSSICQYCKKNKADKNYVNIEAIHLTKNSVWFVVWFYEKYKEDILEIPRCKECYLRQKENMKKSALKYFGLTFLISFIIVVLISKNFLAALWYWLLCSISIWFFLFVVNYPKFSESLSYSDYVPRIKLREKWWYVVRSCFNHIFWKF